MNWDDGCRVGRGVRGPSARGVVGLTSFDRTCILQAENATCKYRLHSSEVDA